MSQGTDKLPLNLAIVGGGRDCKVILTHLRKNPLAFLDIHVVGVCDIDPGAEGLRYAKSLGIYTTTSLQELFLIDDLHVLIELTDDRDVLLDLIRLKPKGIGILDHNIGRLLAGLLKIDQRLESAADQVASAHTATDFLIHQSNERIVVLDTDFSIIEANDHYLEAVSKKKEDVIGAHCYEITHGLRVPCSVSHPDLGCPLVETLRTGHSAHVIHEHPLTEDRSIFCDMVTYPVKDRNGKIIRVIEIWTDITDELSSRWENRVNALKADLKKLVQEDRMISLGKLVASSVHEINNPIQGLLTFSRLMEDTLLEGDPGKEDLDKFRKILPLMSRELERCGNIVSGLLSFSRQSPMDYSHIDVNEVLDAVITLTRHKMELQGIQLTTALHPGPIIIHGDINQLQQCFLNLIFNALEAMPDGGKLSVRSNLESTPGGGVVTIEDTGCGIREEDMDHIFDPFFTTKEAGEGTGLGLSIVHGIVKSHGGKVSIRSRVGKGTSFTLSFPKPPAPTNGESHG